jgi:hypothetical protein
MPRRWIRPLSCARVRGETFLDFLLITIRRIR